MTASSVAKALRQAGYKPCPRWWLTEAQLDIVAGFAAQNTDAVNRVRGKAKQVDAAWRTAAKITSSSDAIMAGDDP